MQASFAYNSNTYTYYVDKVTISDNTSGRQERLISGDMDTDIQDIEFYFSIVGVWEQVSASDKSANALWLDSKTYDITLNPDTSQSTTLVVVPDLSHSPVFSDTTRGVYLETVELRFISKSVYQPTDSVATGLAALRGHYQY